MQSARNSGSPSPGTPYSGEERRKTDRREDATRPWRRLFGGPLRRARGRRSSDHSSYVDVYTRRDVALLLAIFILNVGDAFFTMMWLSRGGREANPVMDFFLDIGPGAFIVQKCFVVGFWLVLLLVHKNFRFARVGLYAALTVYALLMLVHFAIIALGITPQVEPTEATIEAVAPESDLRAARVTTTPIQEAEPRTTPSPVLEEPPDTAASARTSTI